MTQINLKEFNVYMFRYDCEDEHIAIWLVNREYDKIESLMHKYKNNVIEEDFNLHNFKRFLEQNNIKIIPLSPPFYFDVQ